MAEMKPGHAFPAPQPGDLVGMYCDEDNAVHGTLVKLVPREFVAVTEAPGYIPNAIIYVPWSRIIFFVFGGEPDLQQQAD